MKKISTRFFFLQVFVLVMAGYPLIVLATSQPLEDIRQTAVDFVEYQVGRTGTDTEISASRLDTRLRLPLCNNPLVAFAPHNMKYAGNTTIGVKCDGDRPWSIYVPVLVKVYTDILVADQLLPRNKILNSEDFRLERVDISKNPGMYVTDPEQAIGKQLTRALQIGQPFFIQALKAPVSLRRGDKVQLLTESDGFKISVQGESLMNAAIGDIVRVRNLRSRRIIQGKLVKAGTVFVY